MLNTDYEATKAAKFKDKRSRILLDGRQFLCGADKTALRLQVFTRDGFRCVDCTKRVGWDSMEWNPGEMSHYPRRPIGGDSLETCKTRCRGCHHKLDGHGQPMHY